ncbi:MAG: hypothetical protein OR996_05345 [Phycisphaerales bacterium]|jgi:hypothetical protein|nr:hypothetical protein [Phycisphaerales bacterium]
MDNEERQFEQQLTQQELALDAMLGEAFAPITSAQRVSRIAAASAALLPASVQSEPDTSMDEQLHVALAVDAPSGLADRVWNASAPYLYGQPVLATIGSSVVWRQAALAACVVFAVLLAIPFSPEHSTNLQIASTSEVLTVEEEGLLLADLNLGEYAYLADTRELAFADVAMDFDMLRDDLELWQYGLLQE